MLRSYSRNGTTSFSSTQLKALSAVSPHDLSIVNEQVMIGAGLTFLMTMN